MTYRVFQYKQAGFIIKRIMHGPLLVNTYLVHKEESPNTIIIDPGYHAENIINTIKNEGLIPEIIILTHGHFDHIYGAKKLREYYKIPIAQNPMDTMLKEYNQLVSLQVYGASCDCDYPIDIQLIDDTMIEAINEKITIIHTPGHSPGSIVIRLGGNPIIFAGDTIFKKSIGRTDLPGGDINQMKNSIKKLLSQLPDETIIYPGHGPPTRIGDEKRFLLELLGLDWEHV